MKSGKSAPKNNAARAKNNRGKKSGFISKKEDTETSTPVSMKEENSLQAMHAKVQRQVDQEAVPTVQNQADESETMQKQELNEDVQKMDDKEMK